MTHHAGHELLLLAAAAVLLVGGGFFIWQAWRSRTSQAIVDAPEPVVPHAHAGETAPGRART